MHPEDRLVLSSEEREIIISGENQTLDQEDLNESFENPLLGKNDDKDHGLLHSDKICSES